MIGVGQPAESGLPDRKMNISYNRPALSAGFELMGRLKSPAVWSGLVAGISALFLMAPIGIMHHGMNYQQPSDYMMAIHRIPDSSYSDSNRRSGLLVEGAREIKQTSSMLMVYTACVGGQPTAVFLYNDHPQESVSDESWIYMNLDRVNNSIVRI